MYFCPGKPSTCPLSPFCCVHLVPKNLLGHYPRPLPRDLLVVLSGTHQDGPCGRSCEQGKTSPQFRA
jgi:hypothetical protein